MCTNPGVTRGWEARHPQFMKPRDALISFESSLPDLVQVSEVIKGKSIHTQMMQRRPDIVTRMETKYMFFADEAETAKKLVVRGHSCSFNVYFREP